MSSKRLSSSLVTWQGLVSFFLEFLLVLIVHLLLVEVLHPRGKTAAVVDLFHLLTSSLIPFVLGLALIEGISCYVALLPLANARRWLIPGRDQGSGSLPTGSIRHFVTHTCECILDS